MKPFRTTRGQFTKSICVDASFVRDTAVTVAVHSSREAEWTILERMYEFGEDVGFKPFYHKSTNFPCDHNQKFYSNLIHSNRHLLTAYQHDKTVHGNQNEEQIEATHTAMLVDDLNEDGDSLVIIDGNEQRARPFVKAFSGLRADSPPVTHCIQSERYYPSALLADMTARYLAYKLHSGTYDYSNPILRTPPAKLDQNRWGKASSGLYQSRKDYASVGEVSRTGQTVKERIRCWYDGAVAPDRGAQRPLSDSIAKVVNYGRKTGHDRVATAFSQL